MTAAEYAERLAASAAEAAALSEQILASLAEHDERLQAVWERPGEPQDAIPEAPQ